MQPYTAGFAKERCSGGVKEGRKDEGKNDGLSRREGRNGCKRTAEGEGKYRKWQLGKKIRRWSVKERQMRRRHEDAVKVKNVRNRKNIFDKR